MLLNDLNKLNNIDNRIKSLHQELFELYQKRTEIFSVANNVVARQQSKPPETVEDEPGVEQELARFRSVWRRHGIDTPKTKGFKDKVAEARSLIPVLNRAIGESDAFKIHIVPPSNKLAFPVARNIKSSHRLRDCWIDPEIRAPAQSRIWKVFVVYSKPEGIIMGEHESLISHGHANLEGYEMSGLDLREYAAWLLASDDIYDSDGWSLIVRNADPASNYIPCVSHLGGNYSFNIDDPKALIGVNRFRPAMEIK